ncbi:BRCA1-associated RING domain protein 1-like isoform X2 [Diorhabda carinulata]|uniref:BRCA1-associated RING domain protein 1-like isoform X2 n=1 Tax=Diorhabda carinulata TaxID=1163345 RepID=UPI00259FEC55|nr:BRCA1-associated RING domain protein 1-like isoform X2 [Diorhabda carinulata]
MEIDKVETFLHRLEDILKCTQCGNQNKVLGRLKKCGHYFCKTCINKMDQGCPKCKVFVEDSEIDWHNFFVQTEDLISRVHNSLLVASQRNEVNRINTIFYQNKTYKLNFIAEQKINTKGETALHVACRRKKIKEVNNLITHVDINAQDFAGWVPMHEAVESEDYEVVELLLKNGALTDTPGQDYKTPLHKAVICQNSQIVKLLLQYGANRDSIDYFGKTPIDYAQCTKEIKSIFDEEIEIINIMPQLFCCKKMVAHCYYIDPSYEAKLKQSKIKIEENYNAKKVTHFIIRRTHKISIKILTAMLEGSTIVPQEYIDNFLKQDFFISIPDYTFINIPLLNTGIQKSLMNNLLRLPKLFDGISFYITNHTTHVLIYDIKVKKHNLQNVIAAGDGILLHRAPTPTTCEIKINFPFHASKTNAKCCNYIIYEEQKPPLLMYNMAELKHKSSKWLLDCALNFTIFD